MTDAIVLNNRQTFSDVAKPPLCGGFFAVGLCPDTDMRKKSVCLYRHFDHHSGGHQSLRLATPILILKIIVLR